MKLQTQAGMFFIYGKTSELAKIEAVCKNMQEEMGDDMYFADVSEGDSVTMECGYKVQYTTIKEIKDMFKFYKAKV